MFAEDLNQGKSEPMKKENNSFENNYDFLGEEEDNEDRSSGKDSAT